MKYAVRMLLLCGVVMVLIASPAPVAVEPADVVLFGVTVLIAVCGLSGLHTWKIGKAESAVLIAVFLYLSSLCISALMGFINGVSLLMVLRSVVPYIIFMPVIFAGMLPSRMLSARYVAGILIAGGMLQIIYLNYLYFGRMPQLASASAVLRHRITFMDQRTTLPLMLAVPVLSLMISPDWVIGRTQKMLIRLCKGILLLSGLWAGVITLTRAVFLSMLAGLLAYLPLHVLQHWHQKSFSASRFFIKIFLFILCLVGIIAVISLIPRVHLAETGLLARFNGTAAATGHGGDYSNGRIYDEWIPALTAWLQSGPLGMIFGIGAGNAFRVLSGEERTYIHNLTVYSVVYGGFYGLFATVYLYFTLFRVLIFRALQSRQAVYTGMAALLFCLYFYGQLFAVHKGLAFNEMLSLIIMVALLNTHQQSR